MSEHHVTVNWTRGDGPFARNNYNSSHTVHFAGNQIVNGGPAPGFGGDGTHADPESLYASALSTCHMLTFFAVAANRGYVLDSYTDDAVSILEKNDEGKMVITKVILSPKVRFSGEKQPSEEDLAKLHERAHTACFIANSVKTDVQVHL